MSGEGAEVHRRLAVELFNFVWTLLEKPDRTRADEDTMVHAAHASRYHWGEAGTAVNLARGEWQVSRVYAELRRADAAVYHARRSLETCEQNGIGDFDLAFGYEAVARALALTGHTGDRDRYLELAARAGAAIREDEDRELFFSDLATVPGFEQVQARLEAKGR